MTVVFCADGKFASPLGVALKTLSDTSDANTTIKVYVIYEAGTFDESARSYVQTIVHRECDNIELTWLSCARSVGRDLKPGYHFTDAVFLRLRLGELIPAEEDKILYLDCDLIIRCDLKYLWGQPLGDNILLASVDEVIRTVGSDAGIPGTFAVYGLSSHAPYFNSGVMLIGMKRWRELQVDVRASEYVAKYTALLRWIDQDVLNAVVGRNWGLLDSRWNVQCGLADSTLTNVRMGYAERIARIRQSFILHFTGASKPWLTGPATPERFEYALAAAKVKRSYPGVMPLLSSFIPVSIAALGWNLSSRARFWREFVAKRVIGRFS